MRNSKGIPGGGARIRISFRHSIELIVPPAREQLTMVVPSSLAERIIAAVCDAGLFDAQTDGEIHLRPCLEACTFTGGRW